MSRHESFMIACTQLPPIKSCSQLLPFNFIQFTLQNDLAIRAYLIISTFILCLKTVVQVQITFSLNQKLL